VGWIVRWRGGQVSAGFAAGSLLAFKGRWLCDKPRRTIPAVLIDYKSSLTQPWQRCNY